MMRKFLFYRVVVQSYGSGKVLFGTESIFKKIHSSPGQRWLITVGHVRWGIIWRIHGFFFKYICAYTKEKETKNNFFQVCCPVESKQNQNSKIGSTILFLHHCRICMLNFKLIDFNLFQFYSFKFCILHIFFNLYFFYKHNY